MTFLVLCSSLPHFSSDAFECICSWGKSNVKIKRANTGSQTVLQLQHSILICQASSYVFYRTEPIANCPRLSLGVHVPYAKGILGTPCSAISHLNHSVYFSEGVRAHLRPVCGSASMVSPLFLLLSNPWLWFPGHSFSPCFFPAPEAPQPPHIHSSHLSPLCDNLTALWGSPFPTFKLYCQIQQQQHKGWTEKWNKMQNLEQSCESFGVDCAKHLGVIWAV